MAAGEAASAYDKVSDPQTEDALFLLDHLTINTKDSVLDLGCGTGRLAAVIADRVGPEGSVIGVDPDQDRIQVAISKGDGRIQFMVGDDTSFPEGQYDVVACTDVIHWIKDKEVTFKRVYDNLKPGGRFGFTTMEEGLPDLLKQMMSLIGSLEEAVGNFHTVSVERYKELAKGVGFEVTLINIRERKTIFPDMKHYTQCVDAIYQGKYNLSTNPLLDEFKKQYEGQAIDATVPKLTVVLTKPT